MSIMDMFKSAVGAAPAQQQTPQQIAAGNNPMVPSAANTPVPVATPAEATPATPMDGFADLWQTPDPSTNAQNTPLFTVDPAKLQAAASKINFGSVLTPDSLKAIAAGGEGAIAAFQDSITRVAQATYAQSTATTAKLIEQAVARNNNDMDSRLPGMIKKQTVSEMNRADNPLFSNPATAPIMSALETQFQSKYPNATAAEITAFTKSYLGDFVAMATAPEAAKAAATKSKAEPDWSGFLE